MRRLCVRYRARMKLETTGQLLLAGNVTGTLPGTPPVRRVFRAKYMREDLM
jgi:hypothetical protein